MPSSNEQEEFVTITKKYLDSLEYAAKVLQLLEAGGVDNWVWYGESLKSLYEEEEE